MCNAIEYVDVEQIMEDRVASFNYICDFIASWFGLSKNKNENYCPLSEVMIEH